jgi:hypothetical protein
MMHTRNAAQMSSMKDQLGDTLFGDLFGYKPPSPPIEPLPAIEPPEPPTEPPDRISGIPPEVVTLFEKLALDIANKGWSRYSADAILHRIRWHYHIERGMRDFKCNNNWTSQMARWFLTRHPELPEFFETRASPHSDDE